MCSGCAGVRKVHSTKIKTVFGTNQRPALFRRKKGSSRSCGFRFDRFCKTQSRLQPVSRAEQEPSEAAAPNVTSRNALIITGPHQPLFISKAFSCTFNHKEGANKLMCMARSSPVFYRCLAALSPSHVQRVFRAQICSENMKMFLLLLRLVSTTNHPKRAQSSQTSCEAHAPTRLWLFVSRTSVSCSSVLIDPVFRSGGSGLRCADVFRWTRRSSFPAGEPMGPLPAWPLPLLLPLPPRSVGFVCDSAVVLLWFCLSVGFCVDVKVLSLVENVRIISGS